MQIIILITNLFIPIIMIGFGYYFSNHAPSKINYIFGYRTSMSMKNEETWNFAHHHFGRLWKKLGFILLIPSIIPVFFINQSNQSMVETVYMIIYSVQILVLISPIFFTERA
ncbi:MAG: SdpI family protein, partial [Turicibacter sp.]|nr:SdpI family protein [Turicibacter sp.]